MSEETFNETAGGLDRSDNTSVGVYAFTDRPGQYSFVIEASAGTGSNTVK